MNDEVIHRRVESRMDVQYLMISEYIPGFSLVRRKLDEILRIFDMKQEDT